MDLHCSLSLCNVLYMATHTNRKEDIMNTTAEILILSTKSLDELARLFNSASDNFADDYANDIWNAMYSRVYRYEYPNDSWMVGEARERRLIFAVNHHIDKWR